MLHNLMIYPLPSRSIFTLYQALLSLHSLEGMLNVELLVEDSKYTGSTIATPISLYPRG